MSWWQQPQIAAAIDHYQNLSERERLLTQITLHVFILALLGFLLIDPMWSATMQKRNETTLLTGENNQLQQQLFELQSSAVTDPNQALRDQIETLSAQQQSLELRINNLTDALVSPEHMVTILEQMLTQDKRLKITSLVSIPKEEIELEQGDSKSRLFRHGLKVTVSATYPSLVEYLKRLDALRWRLYWQSLEYKVSRYPKGELTLEVYTLSTEEGVLGA